MSQPETWDLAILYSGLDEPAWQEDFNSALEVSRETLAYVKNLPPEGFTVTACQEALCRIDTALNLVSKTNAFAMMLHMTDAGCQDAVSALEKLDEAAASNTAAISTLCRLIQLTGTAVRLAGEPSLFAYAAFFWHQAEEAPHILPTETEAVVLRMQHTGGQAFSRLRGNMEAGMTANVELDGNIKRLPITKVRTLFTSGDQKVRVSALQADIQAGKSSAAVFAACLSAIKGEALTIAHLKGFDSVLHWMLFINRMRRDTLDALLTAIRDALPAFRRFLWAKARYLKYEKGLPYCDIGAPIGRESRPFTLEEARRFLVDAFSKVDTGLADFSDKAFENRWIDAMPRTGKQGGAMCIPLHTAGESRIFLNFDGSISGVATLAHELGHAFHDRCMSSLPVMMRDAPTPMCETASTFHEVLVYERLQKSAKGRDRLFCLNAVLSGAVLLVVDNYSRFLFEDEVIRLRADGGLHEEALCALMRNSQQTVYGDCLHPDFMHPYMWVDKVHYYIPDFHYYNFPYAFGLLFARGLYNMYARQPDGFFPRYSQLLKKSCMMSVEEAGESIGFDVTKAAFWKDALNSYEIMADEFVRLLREEEAYEDSSGIASGIG